MKIRLKNTGSAMIVTVFAVAMMAMFAIGILQITTEDIQIMRNQIYAAQAQAVAEAGLNDAFAQLRSNVDWTSGFANKSFSDGTYTVTVAGSYPGLTITSTAVTSQSFTARIAADVTIDAGAASIIRIDKLRINE